MTCALAGGPWPKKCLLQGTILLDTRDGKFIRAHNNDANDDGADDNNCDIENDVEVKFYSSLIPLAQHVTRHTSHVTRHTSHVTRHTSHVTRHTLLPCYSLAPMPPPCSCLNMIICRKSSRRRRRASTRGGETERKGGGGRGHSAAAAAAAASRSPLKRAIAHMASSCFASLRGSRSVFLQCRWSVRPIMC